MGSLFFRLLIVMDFRSQQETSQREAIWPRVAMRDQFRKLSRATHGLLGAFRECGEGLDLPDEFFAGLIAQSALLDRLCALADKSGENLPLASKMDKICFRRLRDAYSLYPRNPFLWSFLRIYCQLLAGESASRLASAAKSKVVILHISCKDRIDRALASIKGTSKNR
jgi:hypothetical protein